MPSLPALQRVEKRDLGFAVWVPQGWNEAPPDSNNSPYEVARFREFNEQNRHLCLVFRQDDLNDGATTWTVASRVRVILEDKGYQHFVLSDLEMASRPAVRLDCDIVMPFGLWTVRETFAVKENVSYVLGLGTIRPEDDAQLFDEMTQRFELI